MRPPSSVLARVRGSAAAAAVVVGCSGGAPAPMSPVPAPSSPELAAPPGEVVLSAPDPVRYDAVEEAGRLAREEEAAGALAARRERRLAVARPPRGGGGTGDLLGLGVGGVGPGRWYGRGCGRG